MGVCVMEETHQFTRSGPLDARQGGIAVLGRWLWPVIIVLRGRTTAGRRCLLFFLILMSMLSGPLGDQDLPGRLFRHHVLDLTRFGRRFRGLDIDRHSRVRHDAELLADPADEPTDHTGRLKRQIHTRQVQPRQRNPLTLPDCRLAVSEAHQ